MDTKKQAKIKKICPNPKGSKMLVPNNYALVILYFTL
jgi:hypothetical protein